MPIKLFAALSMPLWLSGCASLISTLSGHPTVYGGVRFDAAVVAAPFNETSEEHLLFLWPVALIDLPLSAVCDTLLLPLTLQTSE